MPDPRLAKLSANDVDKISQAASLLKSFSLDTFVVEDLALQLGITPESPDSKRASGAVSEALALARSEVQALGPAPEESSCEQSHQWTVEEWLSSQSVSSLLAGALQAPYAEDSDPRLQLAFVRALGKSDSCSEVILELLRRGDVLRGLADKLASGVRKLAGTSAASGEELNDKFMQDGSTFGLSYGGLSTFFAGLEGLVGTPSPNLRGEMEREHCDSTDSDCEFTTSNYGLRTKSKIEWWFVVDPDGGLTHLNLDSYPAEDPNKVHAGHGRKPLAPANFQEEMSRLNSLLAEASEPPVQDMEFVGGRLYTGPMFAKYNQVLRGGAFNVKQLAFMSKRFEELCCGNKYTTSLHVINSAIVKLGKLTKAQKVWRGISGGILPDSFWKFNEFNVRGGVEFAFMSTTTNQDVAMMYAGAAGAGTVLEIRMGMLDRGADLSWLSQYPFEREICFAPLTGVEVMSTRVEGSVLVVEVRLSVNLSALTIEQVVSKRRKMVMDMCDNLVIEIGRHLESDEWKALGQLLADSGGVQEPAKKVLKERLQIITSRPPEHFNDDASLERSIEEAIAAKDMVLGWPRMIRTLLPYLEPEKDQSITKQDNLKKVFEQSELMTYITSGLIGRAIRLTSVHFNGCHMYAPAIAHSDKRQHVFMWKYEQEQQDILNKARWEVQLVRGHPDQVRLVCRHFGGEHYLYVPEIDLDKDRRLVLLWLGEPSEDILSKSRFTVELTEGISNQIRLRSAHFNNEYLYAPEIDYDRERQRILVWKSPSAGTSGTSQACWDVSVDHVGHLIGKVVRLRSQHFGGEYLYTPAIDHDKNRGKIFTWKGKSGDDVLSKARFLFEPVDGRPNTIRLKSKHFDGKYLYVPQIQHDVKRRNVFLWKGDACDDVKRKAMWTVEQVEPAAEHPNEFRLRSVYHRGYLYTPAIDKDKDRREIFLWTSTVDKSLGDVISKAVFKIEPA